MPATIRKARCTLSGKRPVPWGLFRPDLQPRGPGDMVRLQGRFSDVATHPADGWQHVVDHASALPKTL